MVTAEVGVQTPRICSLPPDTVDSSIGEEAVELAASAGLHLDPWEEFVLTNALARRPGDRWAALEVGLVVPRQNGKGAILEARELAGLFLLNEELIIHSAHEFATSLEAFFRILHLIESTPDLDSQVKRVSRSHGEEGIELKGNRRLRFKTRTKGGGRGFSGDCVIFDEAMIFPQTAHAALFPTLSARTDPQAWYTGSAVDQQDHEHGMVLSRLRERGIKGDDPRLAYFEWSLNIDDPTEVEDETASSEEAWAQANPAFGIRITPEYLVAEKRSMGERNFAVERLGVGDWPNTQGLDGDGIDLDQYESLTDPSSKIVGPIWFVFDVRPDRSAASIAAAGARADGLSHIEIVDRRKGTGWVVDRLVQLKANHNCAGIACDGASPASSLLPKCQSAGLTVETIGPKEHAQACGGVFDAVDQSTLRHLGTPELTAAIRGAVRRPLGDSWAWSRKSSGVDIAPLVAATLALWKSVTTKKKRRPMVEAIG